MSKHGGHSTTTITRPKDRTEARPRKADDTIFGDLTLPIPQEKRLVKGRAKRRLFALGAVVVTAALVAALFVLPVKAWLGQDDDIAEKEQELAALEQANAELTAEIGRLQTPEGVEEAAREEIGYVRSGEIRLTVLPNVKAPSTLPSGWPYDTVALIVAAATVATTSVAP